MDIDDRDIHIPYSLVGIPKKRGGVFGPRSEVERDWHLSPGTTTTEKGVGVRNFERHLPETLWTVQGSGGESRPR